MIPFIWNYRKDKGIVTGHMSVLLVMGWEKEIDFRGQKGTISWVWWWFNYRIHCKIHRLVFLKLVNFTVWKSYLNKVDPPPKLVKDLNRYFKKENIQVPNKHVKKNKVRRCEAAGTVLHSWWEYKLVPLWETIWQFLRKLNMCITHDPTILVLFVGTKICKQPKYPFNSR